MILDGKAIAASRAKALSLKVTEFKSLKNRPPKLAIVLIGDNEASKLYVSMKVKKAAEVGIETEVRQDLNTDADGIIVQLPGPQELVDQIPLEKDVDGLRPGSKFLPATVKGILTLLDKDDFSGEHVVIIGRSNIVGKPMALEMINRGATVTVCNSKTKNLGEITKQADILISATGHPNLITKDMVKTGATVIDVGSPKGDVDFENVKVVAGAITPVPGGVGPMTIVSLLENVYTTAK